jgi:hypothetical protein
MSTQTALIILAAAALLSIAVVFGLAAARRKRTAHLKQRFGPEYDRAVAAQGDASKAESHLEQREKRVEKLNIRPVPPELRERFAASWLEVQARFVDEPAAAVVEADALVRKVMESRGYDTGSFEQGAADVSVNHPQAVEQYRRAHAIAQKNERGEASTEDLRQAFVQYRALFDDLLGGATPVVEVPELAAAGRG